MSNLGNGQMHLLGGGNTMSFAGIETIDEATRKEATRRFNEEQVKLQEVKKAQIDAQIAEANENKKRAESLEIMPLGGQVLVKLYDKNPYDVIEQTSSGLILPGFDGTVFDKESGQEKTLDRCTMIAHVIEVGPEVKYIREGDDIMFRNGGQTPVPFLRQGFWTVHQNNVLVTINQGLQARFKTV